MTEATTPARLDILRSLLERVEGTGPDINLDRHILEEFWPDRIAYPMPEVTDNVQIALDLLGRALPGLDLIIEIVGGETKAHPYGAPSTPWLPTPALALLAALLRAKIAREESGHG